MRQGSRATSPVSAAEEPIVYVIDDDPLMLGALSMVASLDRPARRGHSRPATEFLQHGPWPPVPSCLVLDIRLPRFERFSICKPSLAGPGHQNAGHLHYRTRVIFQ